MVSKEPMRYQLAIKTQTKQQLKDFKYLRINLAVNSKMEVEKQVTRAMRNVG